MKLIAALPLVALLCFPRIITASSAVRLAVLPVQMETALRAQVPELINDYLLAAVQNQGGYDVIGQDDLAALLSLEKQKDLVRCDAASCFAEIGGALDVDKLLVVKLARSGDEWATTAKVMNVRTVRVELRSAEFVGGDARALLRSLPILIANLFGGSSHRAPSPKPANAVVAPQPRPTHPYALGRLLADECQHGETASCAEFVAHTNSLRQQGSGLKRAIAYNLEIDGCKEGVKTACQAMAAQGTLDDIGSTRRGWSVPFLAIGGVSGLAIAWLLANKCDGVEECRSRQSLSALVGGVGVGSFMLGSLLRAKGHAARARAYKVLESEPGETAAQAQSTWLPTTIGVSPMSTGGASRGGTAVLGWSF